MPGPRVAQNLQMPHHRDWQGGQMPRSSREGGGGGGGNENELSYQIDSKCKLHRKSDDSLPG